MKIISGGQTGVDRAALDAALGMGWDIGGWCPYGRTAEDGTIPDIYPLVSTDELDYLKRTRLNVRDAEATLILRRRRTPGTTATIRIARELKRFCMIIDARDGLILPEVAALELADYEVINVAGSRESADPGIYAWASAYLIRIFRAIRRLEC